MTDNASTDQTPEPTPTDFTVPDLTLQLLANLAQRGSVDGVGLTLTVGGAIVTGQLVGRSEWFAGLHEAHGDRLAAVSEPFKKFDERVTEKRGEEGDPTRFNYIHLKGARYLTGAGFAPTEDDAGMFWRGRLTEVSGWSFGMFGPAPE